MWVCGIVRLWDCGIAGLQHGGSVGLRDGGSVDGGSVAAWDYGIMGSILKYYNYYDYVLTKLLLICN